jgi:hypothetical protein
MAVVSLKYKSKQGTLTAPGDVDLGAMIPIATVTVGSGGASTVEFTNIPQSYEHLQLRFMLRSNRSNTLDVAGLQINSNYYVQAHSLNGDGSSVSSSNAIGLTLIAAASASSNIFGVGIIDILDYTNSNKNRVARALSGFDNNGSGNAFFASGLWTSANPATSLILYPANGTAFVQYSQAALYGIKRSGV